MTMADELQKLHALREQGTLTEEEFAKAKQRILDGACASEAKPAASQPSGLQGLQRSSSDRWFGGVCGGLGEATHMPSWAWRILFVLTAPLHGIGILTYLFMWIFVPVRIVPRTLANGT